MDVRQDSSAQSVKTAGGAKNGGAGGDLAELLASDGNGIRITGLVLVVDEVKELKGTSGKGNPYAFANRELQIFTGNKSVMCKQQGEIGQVFPPIAIGTVQTFKIKHVRLNGTVPIFELEIPA